MASDSSYYLEQAAPFTSTFSCATEPEPEDAHTNAFGGIAPSPSTSGRSTLVPQRKLPYDVFINHRGPDVKEGLATGIYKTLTGMGLRVFLDKEELELGDFLPVEIEEAMDSALLHIAILSENYAQSSWCLAELSYMLKTGTQIVPVFYYIETDVVRYAKGVYAEAFSRHEEKGRYSSKMIGEWKTALCNVSYNFGDIIRNKELLKKIVNRVLKEIKNVPFEVAKHPIGLDEVVKDFERVTLQSASSHDNVQVVGIWGMGGSGKTTFAKYLYNNRYKTVEKSSFLLDVRDAASKSLLHNKQKKLLEDLGLRGIPIENIEEGKGILASRLRSVQVLIILDDVDSSDQLDALVPRKDNLGRNSLIIVTTRELQVLRCWGISSIYKMKALNPSHAKQLFCWQAFLQPRPLQEFEDLVEGFLNVCNGLPLSLKIFGAQLYGISSKDYWKALLHKISRVLDKDIRDILKISYDVLDDEEKQIFLDTACFFIGVNKTSAIAAWDGIGWSGLHSFKKLLNKCLIELDYGDVIRMHDHLRDLGREISETQSPFRLWSFQQMDQIINVDKGVQGIAIRGIVARTHESKNKVKLFAQWSQGGELKTSKGSGEHNTCKGSCSTTLLCNPIQLMHGGKLNSQTRSYSLACCFHGLKYFHVRGNFNYQVLGDQSRELVWLRWSSVRHRNLQELSSMENLRVLELDGSSKGKCLLEELWMTDNDAPLQLRELIISGCSEFCRFPKSIEHLKHLKKIVVKDNNKVRSLPKDFGLLQSLEHLKLTRGWLSSLPSSFGDLKNLRYLSLSECRDLSSLSSSFGNLKNLRHLKLFQCANLSSLPNNFGDLKNLCHLNLSWCGNLSSLPSSFGDLTNLRHLDLSECRNLSSLPSSFGDFRNLKHLKLFRCENLSSLPNNFGDLKNLRSLNLSWCGHLLSLPSSFGGLTNLMHLDLSRCRNLSSLPSNLGDLRNLEHFNLAWCGNLPLLPNSFGNMRNLRHLYLLWCKSLSSLPNSFDDLKELRHLDLSFCQNLLSLPNTFGYLENLKYLNLIDCVKLRELPTSFKELRLDYFYWNYDIPS